MPGLAGVPGRNARCRWCAPVSLIQGALSGPHTPQGGTGGGLVAPPTCASGARAAGGCVAGR